MRFKLLRVITKVATWVCIISALIFSWGLCIVPMYIVLGDFPEAGRMLILMVVSGSMVWVSYSTALYCDSKV